MYPFTTPCEMRKIQKTLGHEPEFDYGRPQFVKAPIVITDGLTVNSILHDSTSYTVPWGVSMRTLYNYDHILGSHKKFVKDALVGPRNSLKDFSLYMIMVTNELIRDNHHKLGNSYEVDIIKDVAVLSWTQFVACLLHIPVRGPRNPNAAFNHRELHGNLVTVFRLIYLDTKPNKSFALKRDALGASQKLTKEIGGVCEALKSPSSAPVLLHQSDRKNNIFPHHGTEALERLFEDGESTEEVVSLVILLAVEIVITSSFAISQIINLFLEEPYHSTHWPRIRRLASDLAPWTSEALRVYVLEALRLTSCAAPMLRVSDTYPSISDWRYTQAIKKGDMLLLDIAAVSRDPSRFSDPDEIKLNRLQEAYLPFIDGIHGSLVRDIALAGLVAQLRVLGKMEGLRRAPGRQGKLFSMRKNGLLNFLNEAQDEWVLLPTSMKVHFDSLDFVEG